MGLAVLSLQRMLLILVVFVVMRGFSAIRRMGFDMPINLLVYKLTHSHFTRIHVLTLGSLPMSFCPSLATLTRPI